MVEKIDELIDAVCADPFKGKGKPEPLRHGLKGCWSRHITKEHRLVYSVKNDVITFLLCRYHY
jgi:toxin YoeB